uniref:EF-hand domain-containing protein n=1 Tax=Ciona savignyi TaxID=51511 RepID=H2YYG1_CIOSA
MDISRITFCLLVAFLSCSESSLVFGNDFQRCQQSYDRNIGTLVAEEGMDSVSSIWRILFNNLDLNRNGLLSASEIVVAFETRNLATKDELSLVLSQTQSWIDTKNTNGGNSELNLSGFRDLLSNTMGRMREKSPARKMWEDFLLLMCRYVNQEIPVVVNSFRDLKNCTDAIKNDQLSAIADDDAKKMILNIWKAVFKSIDGNNDDVLDSDDIRLAINQYAVQDNVTEDTTNPVDLYASGSLTRSHFFGRINNLLFGAAEGNLWQRIETFSDLNGNKTFCSLLRHVWNDMERALEGNEECRLSYMEQLESKLGNDGKAAPAIIFTYLDKNKDGIVTSSELNNDQMADSDFPGPLDVANMTSLLPNEVVEVRSQNQSGKMEMSLLSLAEQRTWNLFCKLTTQVLSRYPGDQDQNGGITETDAIEFLLQRANESRLSASEDLQQLYEMLHGLYEVQTTTTTESTSTTAGTTTESIPTTAGTTTESIPTTAG